MIEFVNVVKDWPSGIRAVDNLNLHIPEGEICVLIGPSGCGKTTSMRMINRLTTITHGSILVNGRDNKDLKAEELRRNIGYAIQQIGLFPHMTVAQNIAIVPNLLHWEEDRINQRIDELLELVGMEPDLYRNTYPRQLSGGQQQRVGVARALGADPPIMLMDEPFGAVDPITRETLQEEFLQIQAHVGKTIVFVTHDIDEAIKMGDRIAIMREGKLVQFDTPDTILAHPADRFVRAFVGTDRQLKRLGLFKVHELMDPEVPMIYLDETVEAARRAIKSMGVHQSAFVVDRDSKVLKGWVSMRELQGSTSLLDAMTEADYNEIAVRENATAREALNSMVARGFGVVTPVIDNRGRLKGTVTLQTLQVAATGQSAGYEESEEV